VPLTITSGSVSTFNHKAPTRCTLTFTAGGCADTPINGFIPMVLEKRCDR